MLAEWLLQFCVAVLSVVNVRGVTLAHEVCDADDDQPHDCHAQVTGQDHERHLEGFLNGATRQANPLVFQVKDGVVVSEEGVAEDPVVGLTEGHDCDVAATLQAGDVLVGRDLIGVLLAQSDVQRREAFFVLGQRALAGVKLVPGVVGAGQPVVRVK